MSVLAAHMTGSREARPRRRYRRALAAAALLLGLAAGLALATPRPAAAQCAMCRSAFDSPEGRRMIRKYQIGIAFLLTVPFAAFGTVAYLAIKGKKKLDGDSDTA